MTTVWEVRLREDLTILAESIKSTPRPPHLPASSRRRWIVGGALGLAVATGGAGMAVSTGLLAPAGTSSEPDGAPTEGVAPTYGINDRGQTFGDPGTDVSVDDYPDLIAVVATNGLAGYVDRDVLNEATGANVATPDEAVEWQRRQDASDRDVIFIPVLLADGVTVIGEYPISQSNVAGHVQNGSG